MKKIIITIMCFFMVSQISAENSSKLYLDGEKLALSGKIDEAKKIFERTIELSPYYCMGHYGLGKVYLYDEYNMELAIKEFRAAVQLDQSFAKAHFYLGMAYMFDMKYVAAIKSFAEAYNKDKSYIEALYNIGVIYDLTGDSVKSAIFFEKYKQKLKEDNSFISF